MINMLVGLRDWVDARLPIMRAWHTHMGSYWAPKNFNFWYFFGVLSLLVLVNQLLTGIWLTIQPAPPPSSSWYTCICSGPCCMARTRSRGS
jgi:ubiquinol-cytochrome c reductase cytochrome b subunit